MCQAINISMDIIEFNAKSKKVKYEYELNLYEQNPKPCTF